MNLLKQIFQNLRITKLYSAIGLLSIALGISCSLIIAKYILFETNTDKFHTKLDRVYFSMAKSTPQDRFDMLSSHRFFYTDYKKDSEVENFTVVNYNYNIELVYNKRSYYTNSIAVDSVFSKILDFKLLTGKYEDIYNNPSNILISRRYAKKMFGESSPLQKVVKFENRPFTICGIIDDFPGNSSFNFDVVFPHKAKSYWSRGGFDLVLLKDNIDVSSLNEKLKNESHKHGQFTKGTVKLFPLSGFYFSDAYDRNETSFIRGDKSTLFILGTIGFVILIISLFNYFNIYHVILIKRSKSIGIHKINGAGRGVLVKQFVTENMFFVAVSLVMAISFFKIFHNDINNITGRNISLTSFDFIYAVIYFLMLVVILSVIPITKYSRIDPVKAIKEVSTGRRSVFMRKLSMNLQYIITISLIIVSQFFIHQLDYMLNKDLGINQSNIIKVPFFRQLRMDRRSRSKEDMLKAREEHKKRRELQMKDINYVVDQINSNPYIQNLSFGKGILTDGWSMPWKSENTEYKPIHGLSVSPNYKNLYDLKLIKGRFFDYNRDKSREDKVVINKAALKFFKLEGEENQTVQSRYWGKKQVIGVIDDYYFKHLSNNIEPLVMFFFEDKDEDYFMMKITKGKEKESISFLANLFKKVNPTREFEYKFEEDDIKVLYNKEKRIAKIYNIFSIIAIIISSLGLFSLSIYDVQQRFKEIGVRKINGSSISEIITHLTKGFMIQILISCIVSIPIAWYFISVYLENYAVKAPMSAYVFIVAIGITFLTAYLTLIFQTWKAATKNPVEAIRYE